MNPEMAAVFWALALFEVKHHLCDYALQTEYQWRHKGIYGHPGGFIHAGIHVAGSVAPVLLLSLSPFLVAGLLIAEFLVHYHCDWLKEQINKRRDLTPDQGLFWMVFGADQLVHQLTYVVMLVVLVRSSVV